MRFFTHLVLGASVIVVALSWWMHLPVFLRLLQRREPGEFEHLGGGKALAIWRYLFDKGYNRSFDRTVRRHGAALRWTLCFAPMLAALCLPLALLSDSLLRR